MRKLGVLLLILLGTGCFAVERTQVPMLGQGVMAGEVTANSVILQARLTATQELVDGDLPGCEGVGYFEVAPYDPVGGSYEGAVKSTTLKAVAGNDYLLKAKIAGLKPGTFYQYRLVYGKNVRSLIKSPDGTFRTLHGKDAAYPTSFVVVTGMNYHKFQNSKKLSDAVKQRGFPALETIESMHPDFFVGTGDNVYYDHPKVPAAVTVEQMRRKYHEQFAQPRFHKLFQTVPTYWEKDDHDFRYNDCDLTTDKRSSVELGLRVFAEQLPVVDPQAADAVTYRTYRVNRHLQIWLVEGRDYRSANDMPDGPDKTLWGKKQMAWLKRTLLASDADFKVLISPTPMVGPDDAYKKDNHTNHDGFRCEGDAFFTWLKEHHFDRKNFYIICGDRHWQYHSIHPSGFEEFSCGALVDANARVGRLPGDPKSTDPDAEIQQPYCMTKATGGFLMCSLSPAEKDKPAALAFEFYDEKGKLLYHHIKKAIPLTTTSEPGKDRIERER